MIKSFYMDKGWGVLQQDKEGGETLHYLFEREEGRVVYPFIKRPAGKIEGVQYYDLITPRGQGGIWIEQAQEGKEKKLIHQFSAAFEDYCAREHIVAEYIRFSPWLDQTQWFEDEYTISHFGEVYCTDLTTDFFKDAYSSSVRQQITTAINSNVLIRFTANPDFIDEFLKLYQRTAENQQFNEYDQQLDKKFLQRYFDFYPDKVVFAVALFKEKVISAALLLIGEDIVHYHFSAIEPEYKDLEPNSLLIYEAASYAEAYGKRLFDLGSAKSGSHLEKYKKQFTAKAKKYPFYHGTKIRDSIVYDQLVEQSGNRQAEYFPAYRN